MSSKEVNKGEKIPTNFNYYSYMMESFHNEYKSASDVRICRNGIVPYRKNSIEMKFILSNNCFSIIFLENKILL